MQPCSCILFIFRYYIFCLQITLHNIYGKFQDDFANFSRSKDRLNKLYFHPIGSSPKYTELFSVIRLVLILSHEKAAVESGL